MAGRVEVRSGCHRRCRRRRPRRCRRPRPARRRPRARSPTWSSTPAWPSERFRTRMLRPSVLRCSTTQSMAATTWGTVVMPSWPATLTLTMRAPGAMPSWPAALAGDDAGHVGAVTVGVEVGDLGRSTPSNDRSGPCSTLSSVEAVDRGDAGVDQRRRRRRSRRPCLRRGTPRRPCGPLPGSSACWCHPDRASRPWPFRPGRPTRSARRSPRPWSAAIDAASRAIRPNRTATTRTGRQSFTAGEWVGGMWHRAPSSEEEPIATIGRVPNLKDGGFATDSPAGQATKYDQPDQISSVVLCRRSQRHVRPRVEPTGMFGPPRWAVRPREHAGDSLSPGRVGPPLDSALGSALGVKVDVGTPDSLRERLRDDVAVEAIPL